MLRFVLSLILILVAPAARAELLVFAAASLKEPIDRIAAEVGGVTVSYGGSGAIARQVMLGAPADVVLLANDDWMRALRDSGTVKEESIVDFASNRLVLIGPAGSEPVGLTVAAIDQRRGNGRIAVGLTEAVPAGIYAKAAMQSLGLWQALSPHLAEVDNVRAALALVARGEAPLGIVYHTDVQVSADVAQIAEFPRTSHPPIRYTGATTAAAGIRAADFLEFVRGERGQTILAETGFLSPISAPAD